MKDLIGLDFNFPFDGLIKIADLINYDGPLLSHFVNLKGDNYLFYWVDVNEKHNRWLLFRIDLYSLQNFIKKKITLYEMITNPNDGFVYVVDIDDAINYHNCKMVIPSNIIDEYLPKKDSFYEFEPVDDVDLYALSNNFKSGLLELHLDGGGIQYGSIPLDKFSVLIPKIEDIRKYLATSFIKLHKEDKTLNLDKDAIRNLYLDTKYEYIYSLAGSFRVILRPINDQLYLPGSESFADEFANEFVSIIDSGFKKENLQHFSVKYNKNVIKKYNDFVNYISENKMNFGIKWYNAISNNSKRKFISSKDTEHILTNLSEFEYDETEIIDSVGRFYSINTHTGSYSFESDDEINFKSTGKFDKKLFDLIKFISFTDTYLLKIKRHTKEQIGARSKISDTITSFDSIKRSNFIKSLDLEILEVKEEDKELKQIGDTMSSSREMLLKANHYFIIIQNISASSGNAKSSAVASLIEDFGIFDFKPKYAVDTDRIYNLKGNPSKFIKELALLCQKIIKEEEQIIEKK